MKEISNGKNITLDSGHQPRFGYGTYATIWSNPGVGDTYYATDTKIIYACFVAGTWTNTSTSTSGFFRQFWQKQGVVVQGTWVWAANAGQTDFASVTGEAAGQYYNSTAANLDEYKWSNLYLSAGTYSLTFVSLKASDRGIIEILYGTTSIGLTDMYSAASVSNVITTYTFTIAAPTTADLRFRVNGKNAASTQYIAQFSRLQLEKTA